MVRFSRVCLVAVLMGPPQVIRSRQRMKHDGGNTLRSQDNRAEFKALPRNAMECALFRLWESQIRTCPSPGAVTDAPAASHTCQTSSYWSGWRKFANGVFAVPRPLVHAGTLVVQPPAPTAGSTTRMSETTPGLNRPRGS